MLKTVKQSWNEYAAAIYSKGLPGAVQVEETRKAFYAGAVTMYQSSQEAAHPDVSDEQAMQYLSERHEEFAEFIRDVKQRYAENN